MLQTSAIEIQHGRHLNLTEIREPGKIFLIIYIKAKK